LNSLSGRFGLDPFLDKHVIVDENKTVELEKKYTINSIINFDNGKELVSYSDKDTSLDLKKNPNVCVAISANITASARVFMAKFKINNDALYYSDTDSIDTSILLDPKFVGSELGQFKLEHIFKESVYLAPKVYGGITNNYEYVKVKGLKNVLTYKELVPLLYKEKSLEIKQDK